MIRFDFEPMGGRLNKIYQKLERSVNEMNKAISNESVDYWTLQATDAIFELREINKEVIDMNAGGV